MKEKISETNKELSKLEKFAKKTAIANNILAVLALLLASTMIYLYFTYS